MIKHVALAILLTGATLCGAEQKETTKFGEEYKVTFTEEELKQLHSFRTFEIPKVSIPTNITYRVGNKEFIAEPTWTMTPRESYAMSQLLVIFSTNCGFGTIDLDSFNKYLDDHGIRHHFKEVK